MGRPGGEDDDPHACHFVYCAAPRGGCFALSRPGGQAMTPALSFAPELLLAAQGIRVAFFDIDGVMTDGSIYLTSHDDLSAVMKVASRLGYDLSEEDGAKVYEAFKAIAARKEKKQAQ